MSALRRAVERLSTARGALLDRWLSTLLLVAGAVQASFLWRVFSPPGRPPLQDSIILEYGGWYLAGGARLYVDFFDIKPPLAYEFPAVLALLAGDVGEYHLLAVLATCVAAVATLGVAGLLVFEATGDRTAALLGGLVPLAWPSYPLRAAVGYKPKYFVLACGLAAVWLALRERPLWAGVAGAASVGFWQPGAIFPLVALGVAWERGGRRALARALGGAVAVGLLVLAPVVAWGAVDAMVVETVLVPLLVSEGGTPAERVWLAGVLSRFAVPLLAVGLFGAVGGRRGPRHWWLAALAAWFVALAALLDLDSFPDLFPVLAVAGVGVGVVIAKGRPRSRRLLSALAVGLLLLSALSMGSFGVVRTPQQIPEPKAVAPVASVDAPYDGAERHALYWRGLEPTTCRVFLGGTQGRWVDRIGGDRTAATCGTAPRLPWRA